MKLIIDRKIWFRGTTSRLLAEDGRRCCVGIYCAALGVPDEAIRNGRTVDELDKQEDVDSIKRLAPWLSGVDIGGNYLNAEKLYLTNDAANISERKREQLISRTFADNGVEVEFVG